MLTSEFSNEFDILYNNVMSNQAPGLDEYEKSVFLTKAQDEVLKNYFNPKGNKYQEGFDGNQKRQYDFSTLLRFEHLIDISSHIDSNERFDDRSIPFVFPSNCFISINESIVDKEGNKYQVLPISYDEYHNKMLKPYQYPVKRQAWRLLTDKKNVNCGNITVKTSEGIEAPVKILSTYASDKRVLKFNLIYGNNPDLAIQSTVSLKRVANTYNLEEINCYVTDGDLKLWDDGDDTSVLSLLRNLSSEDDEIGKVNLNHWDGFKHFDFPSRIKIFDIIPTLELDSEVFTITTKVEPLPIAEIVGVFKGGISSYRMRYIKTPCPIIITDLSGTTASIKGIQSKTECELPEELHQEILQRAVELAKSAYVGDLNSSIELGKRSE